MCYAKIAIVSLVVIILIVGVFLLRRESKGKVKEKSATIQGQVQRRIDNYITPRDFSIGMIKEKTDPSSNLCNHKVLYPINGLGVDYGSTMPEGCGCDQFIQPP